MRMYDIIYKKRNGGKLSKEEIEYFVKNYVEGIIPDYQVAALLMAIYFNGMDKEELGYLTFYMAHSGKVYDLSDIHGIKVDKHSTGGVGDGVSLSLAPLVACFEGIVVPMMSGRGLGHTGGTLDKLESIPNFNVYLTEEEFKTQLKKIGVAIIGQSEEIVPADKKIYALRDVTATIDSIPLIAASIMSKKLAEGTDCLVLDVKTGNGAFMEKFDDAVNLAQTMVDIGKECGKKVCAVISDMNQPLGEYVGNSLEVYQAIKILKGEKSGDITDLVLYLATKMLLLAGISGSEEEIKNMLNKKIFSGEAIEKFRKMIIYQKGEFRVIDKPEKYLPQAKFVEPILSVSEGYVSYIDTKLLGSCVSLLGGGRQKMEDRIDYSVGLRIIKKLGDRVSINEPLMYVYYNDEDKFNLVKTKLLESYKISNEQVLPSLIHTVIN